MAKFRITSPEGQTFEIEGEGTQEEALAHFQANYKPEAKASDPLDRQFEPGRAVVETAGQFATGALAAPVAGIAGVVGGILPGPEGQAGDWTRKVQEALTFQPKSQAGQILSGVVGYPFQKLGELADFAGQKTADKIGPAAGAGVNTAVQMAPAILSAVFGGKARNAIDEKIGAGESAAATANSQNSIRNTSIKNGLDAGYKAPPSELGGGYLTQRLESIGGRAAVNQEFQLHNQGVTNSLARRSVEVPDHVPLSMKVIEQKRNEFSQPYREVADVSPLAAKALDKLKEFREEAKGLFIEHERSGSWKAMKESKAYSSKAEMMERLIEKEAVKAGQPNLLERLKEARQKIAKTYDVEAALNLGNGEVSARAIGSMFDKGKPLTGELKVIAEFDQALGGRFTRPGSAVGTPGVSALEAPASILLGAQGKQAGVGWIPAGLPFVRGPARSLLLSDFMQKLPAPQTYTPGLGLGAARMLFDEAAPAGLAAIQASQK